MDGAVWRMGDDQFGLENGRAQGQAATEGRRGCDRHYPHWHRHQFRHSSRGMEAQAPPEGPHQMMIPAG